MDTLSTDDQTEDGDASFESVANATTCQLRERDDAIVILVKQTKAQDKVVADLQDELDRLKSGAASTSSSLDEVKQFKLQEEEEIEQLKASLADRDRRVAETCRNKEQAGRGNRAYRRSAVSY